MSPRGKMPPPTLAIAVGKDKPPAGPPESAPGGEGGAQADMTCPSCGDRITVTLAPAEGNEPPASPEGGPPPGGAGEYGG